jgi:hypothetical protein
MEQDLPFRITVVDPPGGVAFRLQEKKDGLVSPTRSSRNVLSFDFELRLSGAPESGSPGLRGGCAQGPPSGRFVYVNSGTCAGQADSWWTRRAKVPLAGVTWELVEQVAASQDAVLEARIAGKAKDGGPACATVPLLDGGWHVSPRSGGDA